MRRERIWNHRDTPGWMRAGIAILTNAALEREGCAVAVSHETLKARGIDRPPEVELTTAERWALAKGHVSPKHRENLHQRDTTQAEWHPWEAEQNWKDWQAYTTRWGLGTDRHEVMKHVRERFEAQTGRATPTHARGVSEMTSTAPAEMMDNDSAWWRSEAPAYRSDEPAWMRNERHEETQQHDRTRGTRRTEKQTGDLTERPKDTGDLTKWLTVPLIGHTTSRLYHVPGDPNAGDVHPQNHVKFWSHADARAAGYRPAIHPHYGRGAEEAMQEESKARARQRTGPSSGALRLGRSATDEASGRLHVDITNGWDEHLRQHERGMEW